MIPGDGGPGSGLAGKLAPVIGVVSLSGAVPPSATTWEPCDGLWLMSTRIEPAGQRGHPPGPSRPPPASTGPAAQAATRPRRSGRHLGLAGERGPQGGVAAVPPEQLAGVLVVLTGGDLQRAGDEIGASGRFGLFDAEPIRPNQSLLLGARAAGRPVD